MTRRRPSPLTAMLIILAAALVLGAALFRASLSGLLWRALEPMVALRDSFNTNEVIALRAALASSTAALADRDMLAAENAALRAELGRTVGAAPRLLAGVIMRPPGTPYDTLMIDAGSAQGVFAGQRVFAGALVIGVVDEVYRSSARVSLYSAPGQSYDAVLITRAGAVPLLVEGQGAGSFKARVPAATDVLSGDTVKFPGLAGGMVAAVSGISGGDTDTFKTVYLHVPVNLFVLNRVYLER